MNAFTGYAYNEDQNRQFFHSVSTYLPMYTPSYSRRQQSWFSWPWEYSAI